MKLSTVRSVLVVSQIFLCFASTHAQTAAPQDYHVTFRVIGWDAPVTGLKYYAKKDNITPLDITQFSRSGFYDYVGPDPMVFGDEIAGSDGKIKFLEKGTVPLNQFKDRTLLIFKTSQSNPDKYEISAIDDSDSSMPPGYYKFINLTKSPVIVAFAGNQKKLPAFGSISLPGAPQDKSQMTPIELFSDADGLRKRMYSNRWAYGASLRSIVFIYPRADNSIELKTIQEDVASIPTPTPSPRK